MVQRTVHFECRGCGQHVKRRVRRGLWLTCPACGTVNPGPASVGVLNLAKGIRPSKPRRAAPVLAVKPREGRGGVGADREVFEL